MQNTSYSLLEDTSSATEQDSSLASAASSSLLEDKSSATEQDRLLALATSSSLLEDTSPAAKQGSSLASAASVSPPLQNIYNNIPNKFKQIELNRIDENIKITPSEIYDLVEDKYYHRVIIYNFSYLNTTTNEKYDGNIPYYISDGRTNKFRANILLPFMCFSNLGINSILGTNDKCPQQDKIPGKKLTDGILLKYLFYPSINTRAINENILTSINSKAKYDLKNMGLNLTESANVNATVRRNKEQEEVLKSMDIKNILLYLSNNETHDVVSVLPRIDSLINYILVILSDSIDKYKINNYFVPDDEYNKYNMEKAEDDEVINTFPNKFRAMYIEKLLEVLRKHKNIVAKYLKHETIIFNEADVIKKSRIEFNQIVKACDKDMSSVLKVFEKFDIIFVQKIAEQYYIPQKQIENSETKDIREFIFLFQYRPNGAYDLFIRDYKSNILNIWDAKCYRKYLKYKSKYLALKKLL